MSWRTSISSGMCRLWSMAPASAYRSSSFHSTRTGTGITGVGHFTGSAPVGAPSGAIVTAAEGEMPIVRGIDAKTKQIARPIVDKVTRSRREGKAQTDGRQGEADRRQSDGRREANRRQSEGSEKGMNRPANREERSSGRADRGETRERSGGRALSPGDNRGADRGAGGRSEGGRERSGGPQQWRRT